MVKPHWHRYIEYDSSFQRLVIHEYEVTPGIAELLEQGIVQRFDWIKTVWVDYDVKKRVTIKLDLTPEFSEVPLEEQHAWFFELVTHVMNSVFWSFSRTALEYHKIPSRPYTA